MLVLGIIVILGLALHFMNFWYKMQFAEIIGNPMMGGLHAADGYGYIMQTFSNPLFFVLYIIWLIALWFHLTHGFWSAMQTLAGTIRFGLTAGNASLTSILLSSFWALCW